jgi:HAE1 family hydrophobic/amphiphilic exporter-1
MNLAGLAIKRPVFIVMMVLSIITLGIVGFSRLAWDLMPNVEFPMLTVTVIYPGASAEEMENLVAKPMEDSFTVLEGIDTVTTSCVEGAAMITAAFDLGVDIKFAELKVRDKVAGLKPYLPEDIQEPILQRMSFADMPILFMALTGKKDSASLREMLEDVIKPKIETLPGVGAIQVWGGQQRVVKITVDKAMLLANGISTGLIKNAINMRNLNFPVGIIEGVEKNITVRIVGQFKSVDDIANLPMTSTTGKIVRIKDVAKVEFTLEDEQAKVRVNKAGAVMFAVFKQSGANSVKVAERVSKEVKKIQKDMPEGIKIVESGDTTIGIKKSVTGVIENIIIGAILAVLIVLMFLGNFRSAVITAIALPNSIIGAFFLIWVAGFSINVITLLSLSLAVGLLIDDSIVVRENIFRHIEQGMKPKEAAEIGTNEVGLAVISTTLSILAVFIPISFLTGMIGQFFRQFGLTVAFALLVSLLDAFTTAPMLSAYWYKKQGEEKKSGFSKWFYDRSDDWNKFYGMLTKYYRDLISWSLDNKKKIMLTIAGLFLASLVSCGFIGKDFMRSDQPVFSISIETYPGAPANRVDEYIKPLEEFVSKQQSVKSFFTISGGGMGMTSSTNQGLVFVSMKDLNKRARKPWGVDNILGLERESQKDLQEKMRKFIKENKYDRYYNFTAGGMGGSGSSTPILVKIKGPGIETLRNLSMEVKKIIMETEGTADVDTTLKHGKPEIMLKTESIKAEKLGVSTAELSDAINTLVQGKNIARFRKGEKEYNINIRLDEKNRATVDDLKSMVITTRMGKKVPLTAVCDFVYTSGPTEIRRENKERIVSVTADASPGYNAGVLNAKIWQRLNKEIKLPEGYKFMTGGMAEDFAELAVQMGQAMLLALLFMYMILASLYNSFRQPLIIMFSVLLALIGGPLALLMTNTPLDIFGFIGLLMVLGLVAKNGILLIDFTNKMREKGMGIREALLHAAPIRLRPILMTSLAMIFGMLPVAMSMGEGAKGREGLAIVVIGGLLTSTVLTLVAVPVLYEWMENKWGVKASQKSKIISQK